ncbi:hypothetical protein [Palleronia pelagia]|uniref:Uncharacterized protein n=1 Tax=Palleronia pelagia TaxID=387096 RepID=A0A1H8J704_9RHOB|nr:hypothetical protein [Palleronia pelagia]SEN76542.1 hypothetical protein SAMN04488011_106100 [Palleronia pelagia]
MRLILKTLWALARIAGITASLTVSGWAALAPPEPWEQRALDLPPRSLTWSERQPLREMRLMRVVLHVAPGLATDLLSRAAPSLTRTEVSRVLDRAAMGVSPEDLAKEITPAPEVRPNTVQQRRGPGGAKFLKVE